MMRSIHYFVIPLALGLAACAANPGGSGGPVDSDGDGLSDSWEEDNGLDAELADSDGDGFTDGDEVFGYSDAADPTDHPYTGGYERHPWPADLEDEESGYQVGLVAPNFQLQDSHGEMVSLWSFYGDVILLKSSAYWCGPCRGSEEEAQARYDARYQDGFIQLTLLGEGWTNGQPATDQEIIDWAEEFGSAYPVLKDENWAQGGGYEQDGGIPSYHIIGRDMRIQTLDQGADTGLIDQLMAEPFPEVEWDMPGEEIEPDEDAEVEDAPDPVGVTPFGGTGNSDAFDSTTVPTPYGGASCSSAAGSAGFAGLLFGLLGLAVRRR